MQKTWTYDSCLGPVFIDFAKYFLLYKDYCKNQTRSIESCKKFEKARKKKKYRTYIDEERKRLDT